MPTLAIRVREFFNDLTDDQMHVVFAEYTREMGRRDNGQDLDRTQDFSITAVEKDT